MRSKKLQKQIEDQLDYRDIEIDLPQMEYDLKNKRPTTALFENSMKIFNNFPKFLDTIEQTYDQFANVTHEMQTENIALRAHFRKVANFLNNLKQSAFTVDEDGTIKGPVSKFSEAIFGESIVGKNVFNILYKTIHKDTPRFSTLKTAFMTVFGEDEIQWELMSGHFPARIVTNIFGQEKILKVDTNPMWSDEGKLEALIYVIEDVTEFESMAEKVKFEKTKGDRNLQIMQELISCSEDDVAELFKRSDELIAEIKMILCKPSWSKDDVNLIFRNLHTIKGNGRSFNMHQMSAATHKVESKFCEIEDINSDLPFFEKTWMPVLISQLEEYKALARKIYHSDKDSINLSTKSKMQVESIRKIITSNKVNFTPEVFQGLSERFSELLDDSSYSHLKKFAESTIRASCIDCEKEVEFDIQGSHFVISEGILSFIKDSMVHILRNSVDHGIEQAEDRLLAGKKQNGKINVNILPTDKALKIEIVDDGAGIDFKKIKEKAIALRFLKNVDAEKVTHDQLMNILFSPGFTTKDKITETSGRGVGLDAARENVEKIGGRVEVESVFGMGTTFKLLYPMDDGVIELLSARAN
jgi:hypothetical protein